MSLNRSNTAGNNSADDSSNTSYNGNSLMPLQQHALDQQYLESNPQQGTSGALHNSQLTRTPSSDHHQEQEQQQATDITPPITSSAASSSAAAAAAKKAKRSSKACIICHQRKIKCDLDSKHEGEKCSNCAELGLKCELYKRKKRIKKYQIHENLKQLIEKTNVEKLSTIRLDPVMVIESMAIYIRNSEPYTVEIGGVPGETEIFNSIVNAADRQSDLSQHDTYVALASDGLVNEKELKFLSEEGCFSLPSKDLCDLYIAEYFKRVHPGIPIINKAQFLEDYKDLNSPPSLLLLQAVLTVGSRDINEPCIHDQQRKAQNKVTMLLYRRAALLLSNFYEVNPLASLQSMILLGFVRPSDNITLKKGPYEKKSPLYWCDIAAIKANSLELQRQIPPNCRGPVDACTAKKIFWYLFQQDTFLNLSSGKPRIFDVDSIKLPKLIGEDFRFDTDLSESTKGFMAEASNFAELAGYIFRKQEEADILAHQNAGCVHVVKECDILLASWFEKLPEEFQFKLHDKRTQNIYSAFISVNYYMLLINIHSANIRRSRNLKQENYYPSWGIIFQSALLSFQIISRTRNHNTWPFISPRDLMYLFHVAKTMLYFVDSNDPAINRPANEVVTSSLEILRIEASKNSSNNFFYTGIYALYADRHKRSLILNNLVGVVGGSLLPTTCVDPAINPLTRVTTENVFFDPRNLFSTVLTEPTNATNSSGSNDGRLETTAINLSQPSPNSDHFNNGGVNNNSNKISIAALVSTSENLLTHSNTQDTTNIMEKISNNWRP